MIWKFACLGMLTLFAVTLTWEKYEFRCLMSIAAAVIAAIVIYNTDDGVVAEHAREEAAKVARRRVEETPHVIREADGCKVYAFLSGDRYHYFTRCPDSKTTTDSSWDECRSEMVGKVSTRKCVKKSESIEVTK